MTALNKIWMVFALCFDIGRAGVLFGFKRAQANEFFSNADHCLKAGVVRINADKSRFVGGHQASVLLIEPLWDITQIGNSIVRSIAVDVVNLIRRPDAMHIEPRESMGWIQRAVNANPLVSLATQATATSKRAGAHALPLNQPRENAGFWVVVQKFAQTLRGKIGLSHDALLLLIGQRPARVDSACGLRYFKGN